MPAIKLEAIFKHGLMLLLAFFVPPVYFVIRKRYGVAILVTIVLIVLGKWHAYAALFAMTLSFLSELIQIGLELYYHIFYTTEPEEDEAQIVNGRLIPRPKK